MEDDDQTRPEVPNSRSPDFPRFPTGRETRRESPNPDSAGTGNRDQIPRFPIRPGPGIAVPDRESGSRVRHAGDFLVWSQVGSVKYRSAPSLPKSRTRGPMRVTRQRGPLVLGACKLKPNDLLLQGHVLETGIQRTTSMSLPGLESQVRTSYVACFRNLVVLRNTLTSSNGLKLEGHVLETGITQQRRGDTKERSGRCRFMCAGGTPKERRQTKEKLPDDEPAVVLCIRCYCALWRLS
jgi:hypothetical protein